MGAKVIQSTSNRVDVLSLLRLGLYLGRNAHATHPGLQSACEAGFAVQQCIGVGGTCEVWHGAQRDTGQSVAIKVAKQGELSEKDAQSALSHEKRILCELDENIAPKVVAHAFQGQASYLVMEAVDGIPVDEAMSSATPKHATQTIRNMLTKLARMHTLEIVHGDLKTNHILVAGSDVRIIDFGFSHFACQRPSLMHATLTGATDEFMAPEMRSNHLSTKQSDVYSIGCILERVAKHCSKSLGRILNRIANRARQDDPALRPKSALELLEQFDSWLLNRRRVRIACSATLIALVATTVIYGGTWQTQGPVGLNGAPQQYADISFSDQAWIHALRSLSEQDVEVIYQATDNHSATSIAVSSSKDRVAWGTSKGFVEVAHASGDASLVPLPAGYMLEAMAWDDKAVLHAATDRKELLALQQTKWTQVGVVLPGTRFIQQTENTWTGWDSSGRNLYNLPAKGQTLKVIAEGTSAMAIPNAPAYWLTVTATDAGDYACQVIHPNGDKLVGANEFTTRRPPTACSYDARLGQLLVSCGDDVLIAVSPNQLTRQEAEFAGPATALLAIAGTDVMIVATSRLEIIHRKSGRRIGSVKLVTGGLVMNMSYDPKTGFLDVVTNMGWERWHLPKADGGLASL